MKDHGVVNIREEVLDRIRAELSQGETDAEAAIARVIKRLKQEGRGEELTAINWDLEADLAGIEAMISRKLREAENRVLAAAFLGVTVGKLAPEIE